MNVLLALVLLAVAAFCGFGFLATFEPVPGALAWRTGYVAGGLACVYGALRILGGGGKQA